VNVHLAARAALLEGELDPKLSATARLWEAWQAGDCPLDPGYTDPDPVLEAGRPERPRLAPPREMPPRKLNSPEGHAALIHSLAHIEFNAINLGLDAVYRFPTLPAAFHADWLQVAAEEAYHFRLLRQHLLGLGYDYGDFPAHAGLWELARSTAADPLVRMALVPRLMEARGLDVTPDIQRKLRGYGDPAGADLLDIILRDEIGHVASGDRWFRYLCHERDLDPESTFKALLAEHHAPRPRRPLNEPARIAAGFSQAELARLLDGDG